MISVSMSTNFNEIMVKFLWHFYFFKKIFNNNEDDKYNSIFTILKVYKILYQDNKLDSSIEDNLK